MSIIIEKIVSYSDTKWLSVFIEIDCSPSHLPIIADRVVSININTILIDFSIGHIPIISEIVVSIDINRIEIDCSPSHLPIISDRVVSIDLNRKDLTMFSISKHVKEFNFFSSTIFTCFFLFKLQLNLNWCWQGTMSQIRCLGKAQTFQRNNTYQPR